MSGETASSRYLCTEGGDWTYVAGDKAPRPEELSNWRLVIEECRAHTGIQTFLDNLLEDEGAAKAQIELAPVDPQLACSGDDARICCPLALGAEVVVMARFRKESDTLHGPRFVLDQATICAM